MSADLAGAINDDTRFGLGNVEFHDIIAWASGSTVLRVFLASINNISDARNSGIKYTTKFRREIVQDHDEIVAALSAHDASAAERAMIAAPEQRPHVLEARVPRSRRTPHQLGLLDVGGG